MLIKPTTMNLGGNGSVATDIFKLGIRWKS